MLQTKKTAKSKISALSLFTFEILITTNYFDLSLQKSNAILHLRNIKHFRVDIQLYQHEWKLELGIQG